MISINIFLLFFSVVILFISSYYLQHDFTDRIYKNNKDSLMYVSKEIESDMTKLITSFYNISTNQSLLYFQGINTTVNTSYITSATELIKFLRWNRNMIDNIVDDFIVYFEDLGYVVSSTYILKESDMFMYDNVYHEEVIKYSNADQSTGLVIEAASNGNNFVCFQSGTKRNIVIYALLKEDYIRRLLEKSNVSGASVIITDSKGEILLASDKNLITSGIFDPEDGSIIKLNNVKYLCNSSPSEMFDFKYFLAYPKKYINNQVFSINKIIIPVLFLYCLIISIIVYTNGMIVRKPLKKILNNLNRNPPLNSLLCNEFEIIDSSIKNLTKRTSEMEYKITNFNESNMLNRMLYGKHISNSQILNSTDTRYFILTIAITGSSDNSDDIINEVDSIISGNINARIVNFSENLLTYMVIIKEGDTYNISADQITCKLSALSDRIVCGLSNECSHIIHIRMFYIQSIKALIGRKSEERSQFIYFYRDIEKKFNGDMETELNITMDETNMLIHMISRGEVDKLSDFLTGFKNSNKSFISFRNTFIYLLESLLVLLKKENVEMSCLGIDKTDIEKISNINNIYDFSSIESLMNKLLISSAEYFRNDVNDLNSLMVRFINENYDKGISMNMLVDEFKKSRSYIAECVKNATGHNYLDYITLIKMRKAKELLKYTTMNLDEITKELDYMNANYLVRKFKSYFGKTPGQYRSTINEEIYKVEKEMG
jgi:AraC-like DNA-binding protein